MTALRTLWRNLVRPAARERKSARDAGATGPTERMVDLDLPASDPLGPYLQSASGVVALDGLAIASPALDRLRAAGTKLAVPLVSQGELVGILALGGRLSEQGYSSDDRKLLADLAAHAAPAVRVAQLVRHQRREALERGRVDQEMRIAGVIQQSLLPKRVPELPDWRVDVHYQPAREVGGDFYDFLEFDDGHVAFIVGDVTDKGVPAAMVMATTRSLLRTVTERLSAPGEVLERVNDLLHPDIPERMFVTCFYALLDPASGLLRYANAGHDLPYRRGAGGVDELRATGMPLGSMPAMHYEEFELQLMPGDTVLFHSDGLVEAHDPSRAMFGFPRLKALMAEPAPEAGWIALLLERLAAFTGPGWEQEDDVTLVTLQRTLASNAGTAGAGAKGDALAAGTAPTAAPDPWLNGLGAVGEADDADGFRVLDTFSFASVAGNERRAAERTVEASSGLGLAPARLERLRAAVAEAIMNAMEHGNDYRPELPVTVSVAASRATLRVAVTDLGGAAFEDEFELPDLEAKLAGETSPRGWGQFLIYNMVDAVRVQCGRAASGRPTRTVELVMELGPDDDGAAGRSAATEGDR